MSTFLFKAISFASHYLASGDTESFNFHADKARDIAASISYEAYLTTSLALHSCIDGYRAQVIAENSRKSARKSEYGDVHTWVRMNNSLNFSEGVKLPSGRFPDFVSHEDGITYPVECKIRFTRRSLNQLLTYMDEMGVDKGYAVAFELRTDLPDGVEFIKVGS